MVPFTSCNAVIVVLETAKLMRYVSFSCTTYTLMRGLGKMESEAPRSGQVASDPGLTKRVQGEMDRTKMGSKMASAADQFFLLC